jgi:hypothetical protein
MRKLVQALYTLFSYFLGIKSNHFLLKTWISNISASFILMSSYVLGCLAMYHYFSADWGKTAALCLLAAVLFLTSLILYGISWLLKPKKNFPGDIMQSLGKSFDLIHQANILKNMFSGVFSKVLGSVLLMIMFIIWEKRHQRNNK